MCYSIPVQVSPRRSARSVKATKKCKDCPNCSTVHDLMLNELEGEITIERKRVPKAESPSKTAVGAKVSPEKGVKASGKVSRVMRKKRSALSRSRRRRVFPCKCGKSFNFSSNLKRHEKFSCVLIFGHKTRREGKTKPVPLPIKDEPSPDSAVKKGKVQKIHLCECGIKFDSTDLYKIHKVQSCEVEPANDAGFQLQCLCGLNFSAPSSYYSHRKDCQTFIKGLAPFSGPVPKPKAEAAVKDEPKSPRKKGGANEKTGSEPDTSTLLPKMELPKIELEPLDDFAIVAPSDQTTPVCKCGRSFASTHSHSSHLRYCPLKHLYPKPFRCHCGAAFNHKLTFTRHQFKAHGKTAKSKTLPKAPQTSPKKGSETVARKILRRGVKREKTAGQPAQCVCGKEFANKALMLRHVKNTCGFDLRCPMCGKNHPIKPLLYHHMKNEHGIIPETVYPFRPEDEAAEDPSI